ncbi:MAG: hypothetical protein K8T20_01125 [Planctomycetes bacterium]|nr:hypothetical protein [Planctomycetota bacterium]
MTYPVTVKLPDWRQPAADDSIRQKIGEIEALKAKGAGPEYLASAYLGLGGHYESIWRDEAAIEAWNKGLALAVDDGQRNLFIESIARNAFQRGDMDAFLAGMEKLKQQVSYQDVAEWVLAIEGKPGKAKLLKAKVPDIKEEELERFRQWPNDGDEIAE